MIITLIFAIIFIASIVALIIAVRKDGDWFDLSVITLFIGVLGTFFCGIGIIINNSPISQKQARIEYEETIVELNAIRESISTIENDYSRIIAIKQYNTDARKFKTDIEQTQAALKNPWVSWFNNYAYADFDADVVSYL